MLVSLYIVAVALVAAGPSLTRSDPPPTLSDPHSWSHPRNEATLHHGDQTRAQEKDFPQIPTSRTKEEHNNINSHTNQESANLDRNSSIKNSFIKDSGDTRSLDREVRGRIKRSDGEEDERSNTSRASNLPKRSIEHNTDTLGNNLATHHAALNTLDSEKKSVAIVDSEKKVTAIIDSESKDTAVSDSASNAPALTDSGGAVISKTVSESKSTGLTDSESKATGLIDSESKSAAITDSESKSAAIIDSEIQTTAITDSDKKATAITDSDKKATAISDSESKPTAIIDSEIQTTAITDSDKKATTITNSESKSTTLTDSESNATVIAESNSKSGPLLESETAPETNGSGRNSHVLSESEGIPRGTEDPIISEWKNEALDLVEWESPVYSVDNGNGSKPTCSLLLTDLFQYTCGDQTLKVLDKKMEVVCKHKAMDCSALPAQPPTRLIRLEVTACSLPPALPLTCVGGSAEALAITQAESSLTALNVAGLNATDLFIMANPGAIREIPMDAIGALPRLEEFRLVQGSNVSLRGLEFPPSASRLRYLEVSISGVSELPRAALASLSSLTKLSLFKNNIDVIHPQAFQGLESLRELVLNDNPLRSLPPGALPPSLTTLYLERVGLAALREGHLTDLPRLTKVVMSSRGVLSVGARALSRLPALAELSLTASGVTALPADLFLHSPALRSLDLSQNRLSSLPAPLWELRALQQLDLSSNELRSFSSHTFSGLRGLRRLHLAGNHIREIPAMAFSGLPQLSWLSLSHNEVSAVSALSLAGAGSLRTLSLSHNRISWAPSPILDPDDWSPGETSPFSMLINLQELDLSHNNISVMYSDWRIVMSNLSALDLSHNSLHNISAADQQFLGRADAVADVSHNNITHVAPCPAGALGGAALRLHDNPFHCDCDLYDFITMVQAHSRKYLARGAACASPPALAGTPLPRVPRALLACPLDDVAPCACRARPHARRIECDCPHVYDAPDISQWGMRQMSLRLRHAPPSWSALPPTVTDLQLGGLQLRSIPPTLLAANLTFSLQRNPLDCSCFALDDVRNLQKYAHKILDYDSLQCDDGSLVSQKDTSSLCDLYKSYLSAALIALGLLLTILTLATLFAYRVELIVLLYRHGCCLPLLPKEKEESGKAHDVFLSFALEDEKFVLENILPQLQAWYRVHVQGRDWEVGATIPDQIRRSVESSRRTLVVLSPPYLREVWAREVLRAAHAQANADKRTRAVTITVDVDKRKLDKDVKTLLSLSTFVRYKEALFWDKVRFALPRKGVGEDKSGEKASWQRPEEASRQHGKEASWQRPEEASRQHGKEASWQRPEEASRQHGKEASWQRPEEASRQHGKEASWQRAGLQVVRTEGGKLVNMAYVKDV